VLAGAEYEDPNGMSMPSDSVTAEQRPTSNEARFRALVESSLEITSIVDAEGVVRYVSPSVESVLGFRQEELLGAMSFGHIHPDDVDLLQASLATAASDPRPKQLHEIRVRHKDGSWRLFEVVARDLLDDPAVQGVGLTSRDVTEKRRLQARVAQSERLDAIGQLAGGIAHDFNNVLLVIRGYSSVLRATLENPNHLADIGEIANAAERATELTRQLLAFGRRQLMQPQPLEIAEVVRDVESLLRRSLREDVEFEIDVDSATPVVMADPTQIEQVLMNLVVNARDAIDGTGHVRLVLGEATVGDFTHPTSPPLTPGRYATLTVEDDGSGIDDAVRPHIFDPFFTTKPEGIGTGLGLSTVHGIVAQSGGGIEVRTSPAGTTFVVYLPGPEEPASAAPVLALVEPAAPDGAETILLVEDEDAVRGLVRRVLEGAGYEVLVASRPSEAEALLTEHEHLDLLLTDVVMPEMSGYDLARRIEARRPGLAVLFMSGYAPQGSVDADAGELLKKPFTPDQLAQAIRAALDARGSR
jgi:PAS domain S-box-containing protein